MDGLPSEYQKYAAILNQFGPFRVAGNGLTFRCVFPERHKNGDRTPSMRIYLGGRDGALFARCMGCGAGHDEIVKASGVPVAAWFPNGAIKHAKDAPKAKFACKYVYQNESGRTVAIKSRYEPGWNGAKKSFLWTREITDSEIRAQVNASPNETVWACSLEAGSYSVTRRSNGRIILEKCKQSEPGAKYSLPSGTGDVSLYNLHKIKHADPQTPIVVVEGEKDADNLIKLGFNATTGYAGKGKWEPGWAWHFAGRRVVICPDVDGPNQISQYAQKIAADCIWHNAAEIRIANLPHDRLKADGSGDITDYIASANGDPKQSVIELFERSNRWIRKVAGFPHK